MPRSFYEDDELVINKPGYNTEISDELKEQEGSHGPIAYVQGMGVRSTPYLEQYINRLRLFVHSKAEIYEAELGTQKSAFLNELNSLSNAISSTIKEPVLPGLVYILTSTLTGSILVNRRALPIRFITPIVFGAGATSYFMPNTFDTWTKKYEESEKENFPEFNRQKHQFLTENYAQAKSQAKTTITDSKIALQKSIHDARVYVAKFLE